MLVNVNPYLSRTAIRDDGSFVGRSSELLRLFNRIGGIQPQSVSIVGDRRIGKSSILRALIARRGKHLPTADKFVFVFMDIQSRLEWSVDIFLRRAGTELSAALGNTAHELQKVTPYEGLESSVRSLAASGRVLVLLIDEFQLLMTNPAFPVEFFNYLRSLANSYPVSLVVTSHCDLYTLSRDSKLSGSPLFNILHKLQLGPFTESEARQLIEVPSCLNGCPLATDASAIIARAGFLPLYLQIACSSVFEWRMEHSSPAPLDEVALDARFMEEATPHFDSTWRLFNETERRVLIACAKNRPVDHRDRPQAENLAQRGYLVRRGGGSAISGDAFHGFVLRQSERTTERVPAEGSSVKRRARARVFLSYASEDRDQVVKLYERLVASGYEPWLDAKQLLPGEPWAITIDQAIRTADFFVLCLSTRSVAKDGVLRQEMARGLHHWYSRQDTGIYLIPARLEECEMPVETRHLQWVDLWRDDGWPRLRQALEAALAQRSSSSASGSRPSSRAWAAVQVSPDKARHAGHLMLQHALVIGSCFAVMGLLLLMIGLSPTMLSALAPVVGLENMARWHAGLRAAEIGALAIGSILLGLGAIRKMGYRWGAPVVAVIMLAAVAILSMEIPSPNAFVAAFDEFLGARSVAWRARLFGFRDPSSGAIRDGADPRRVQAWTTAQVLVGVLAGARSDLTPVPRAEVRAALDYFERVRLPQPMDGWGYFENKKEAITEITSWVTLAEVESLRAGVWTSAERPAMVQRITRDLRALLARQTASGGWSPVSATSVENARTYSTVMALWAISAALREGIDDASYTDALRDGTDWLLEEHNPELGWVPNPARRHQTEEFPGLSAQVLVAFSLIDDILPDRRNDSRLRAARERFLRSHLEGMPIQTNARVPDTDQHLAGSEELLEGSTFLWYPWSLAAFEILSRETTLSDDLQSIAARRRADLSLRAIDLDERLSRALPYQVAENLFCVRVATAGGTW